MQSLNSTISVSKGSWEPLEAAMNLYLPAHFKFFIRFAILLLILVGFVKKVRHVKRLSIKNLAGQPIRLLKGDARVAKFTQPHELSASGQSSCGPCPFLVRNGKHRELVITRPDHLREFYKDDTKHHPKPKNLNMGPYFGELLGHAVGAQAGDRWNITRRYFTPAFDFQTSRSAMPMFTSSVKSWVEGLELTKVDLPIQCRFLPFQIVAQLLYGKCYDNGVFAELLRLNEQHEVILHDIIGNQKLINPLWKWLNPAARQRMAEYSTAWERFNLNIIWRSRSQGLEILADLIYRGVDPDRRMTKPEFLHTMDEILFANVEVSSRVLITLLWRLSAGPEFQARLRNELSDVSPSNFMDYFTRRDTLLNYTVMESMRLSPAFAFSLPESTSHPKIIGGFSVPSHTPVIIDAHHLNRDVDTWGSDSNDFHPERFEKLELGDLRYSFMRFGVGGGAGRCLGKNVADLIFKAVIVEVLREHEITRIGESEENEVRFVPLGGARIDREKRLS